MGVLIHWESSIHISPNFSIKHKIKYQIYIVAKMAVVPNGSTKPQTKGSNSPISGGRDGHPKPKKQILLNAFDMSTVEHLSPGQWKV